jgi:frataxin-like iron-binding protein CyaY
MNKLLGITVLFFLLSSNLNAAYFKTGDIINNEIKINKHFKISLSKGDWEVVRRETLNSWGLNQRIIGIVRVENNEVMEMIEIYEGLLGAIKMTYIDQAIFEMTFKNKYDGCYDRPEYFLLKLYQKGKVHNCMVVRHWDLDRELFYPDDPNLTGVARMYKNWIQENNITLPKIVLASEHSYFSRHVGGNWFSVIYVANPKMLGAPKNNFLSEERSEYHKFNINKHPKHKKIMEKWISISSGRHYDFENSNRAKKSHKLDLSMYLSSESKNSQKKSDKIITQIKKLNELYKDGILTKEEFEKAKKSCVD